MCALAVAQDATDVAALRVMRDDYPVWRDEEHGVWHVYRYAAVSSILSNYHSFSSDFQQAYPDRADLLRGNIVALDPPRHEQLRRLVSLAFSPRRIAQLEVRIAHVSQQLIDQIGSAQRFELVDALAYPLPVTVIAELLGVPADDRALFKSWADALLDRDNAADMRAARTEIKNFHDYLRQHVLDRRRHVRDDLISDLVTADIDGQRLADDEIFGFATLLLLAGHITTTLLLGNAVLCFDEYPAIQRRLRVQPGLLPGAIEEVLRYRSPVPHTARITTTDVELVGQPIPAHQTVMLSLLSANHDERQFADPETFIVDRQPNPHLALGKGIHFCLGAPLARLEARIALHLLLQRFSDIRVDPTIPSEAYARFNGQRTLHLHVD